MEASGAIIPSTVCSSITRSSRLIFRKSSQAAVKDIITGIFQLIQVNHLGTIYWVQWYSQKVGVWGKTVFGVVPQGYYPSVGKGVIKHVGGVNY